MTKSNQLSTIQLSTITISIFIAVLTAFSLNLLSPDLILAQETTETTDQENTEDPSPTSPETTEKLRERIEKIVEEKKDQVKGVIDDFSKRKTGFIGQVTRVSEETIAVETNRGTKILPLDEGVKLLKGTTEITPDKIEVDNWALVMGYVEDDSFVPRRIVFSSTSLRPNTPVVYLGTIKSIKSRAIDFQPRGKEEIMTLTISTGISYQNSLGEKAVKTDFFEDDQVLLVGYLDKKTKGNVVTVIRALAPFQKDSE